MSARILLGALAAAAAAAFLVGSAAATPTPGGTTDVTFVPIAGHRVLSNTYLAAGHSSSPVLIGGSTTIPTNATTVQLLVLVKGTATGSLFYYPAGNTAAGQTFTWVKGGGQATLASNIGTANEVTFVNQSSAAINLTVTITGYSTQVSAGDITGSGGAPGQVLTNTGAGATWGPGGTVYVHHYPRLGLPTDLGIRPAGELALPAGAYDVRATGTLHGYGTATAYCELLGYGRELEGSAAVTLTGSEASGPLAMEAVVSAPAAISLVLDCSASVTFSGTYLESYSLVAVPMGTVHDQG